MEYTVGQKEHDRSNWYILGLPDNQHTPWDGEGAAFEEIPEPEPDTWIWLPRWHDRLDLFESLYAILFTKLLSHQDILREGDVFVTPVGRFLVVKNDIQPHDEVALKYWEAIQNEPDEVVHKDVYQILK